MREVEALDPKASQQYWQTINNLTGQTKAKKPLKLINPLTNTRTNSEKETADIASSQDSVEDNAPYGEFNILLHITSVTLNFIYICKFYQIYILHDICFFH